ncbi:MAG: OmpA family protein [Chloroherpetonaceae bacterium]|nr:OmpA family protein [Chloroherpetonaceae bacterium]
MPLEYFLTVVELEEMKQEVVASSEILDALNKTGRVALYINFDVGKDIIKPESQPIIDEVVKLLRENPSLKLSIEGHTDDTGTPEGNQRLSEMRAKAVMNALVSRGIDAKRLSAVGYGRTKPIADNATEEGRAKNRRVELVKK